MNEEVKTPEVKVPIMLSQAEITGLLNCLRRYPMEQVENLVTSIRIQAAANQTGETE